MRVYFGNNKARSSWCAYYFILLYPSYLAPYGWLCPTTLHFSMPCTRDFSSLCSFLTIFLLFFSFLLLSLSSVNAHPMIFVTKWLSVASYRFCTHHRFACYIQARVLLHFFFCSAYIMSCGRVAFFRYRAWRYEMNESVICNVWILIMPIELTV